MIKIARFFKGNLENARKILKKLKKSELSRKTQLVIAQNVYQDKQGYHQGQNFIQLSKHLVEVLEEIEENNDEEEVSFYKEEA